MFGNNDYGGSNSDEYHSFPLFCTLSFIVTCKSSSVYSTFSLPFSLSLSLSLSSSTYVSALAFFHFGKFLDNIFCEIFLQVTLVLNNHQVCKMLILIVYLSIAFLIYCFFFSRWLSHASCLFFVSFCLIRFHVFWKKPVDYYSQCEGGETISPTASHFWTEY